MSRRSRFFALLLTVPLLGAPQNPWCPECMSGPPGTPDPELTVDAITVVGDQVYAVISNPGQTGASGFWVDLHEDWASVPAPGDYGDQWLWVDGLSAGTVTTVSFTTSATWVVDVQVDTADHVAEADETNNISSHFLY